jgi:hypothetical protein
MDKTVGQPIQALEQKLDLLNSRIMDENDRAKRNQLESELRAVESPSRFIVRHLRLKNGL